MIYEPLLAALRDAFKHEQNINRIRVTPDAPPETATIWRTADESFEMVIHPAFWDLIIRNLPNQPNPFEPGPWFFAGIEVVFDTSDSIR